jgi:hypothetical protein
LKCVYLFNPKDQTAKLRFSRWRARQGNCKRWYSCGCRRQCSSGSRHSHSARGVLGFGNARYRRRRNRGRGGSAWRTGGSVSCCFSALLSGPGAGRFLSYLCRSSGTRGWRRSWRVFVRLAGQCNQDEKQKTCDVRPPVAPSRSLRTFLAFTLRSGNPPQAPLSPFRNNRVFRAAVLAGSSLLAHVHIHLLLAVRTRACSHRALTPICQRQRNLIINQNPGTG